MHLRFAAALAPLLLAACVQPYGGPPVQQVAGPALATQDETARIENDDRIARFRRLADMQGIAPPRVDQLILPPNSVAYMAGPVPVVRVVFDDKVFFDFDSDVPRPDSGPVFDLLAENMRRDVLDAAVTVLGHTDAIGTDDYNVRLSARRAASVMQELARRGVRVSQLSEVAIGKRQPIAPNDTAQGRALNRRVEFLVSSSLDANLAAVQQRVVPASYLSTGTGAAPPRLASVAQVLRMQPDAAPTPTETSEAAATLIPYAGLPLEAPAEEDIERTTTEPVAQIQPDKPPQMQPPEQVHTVTLIKPERLNLAPLNDSKVL